MRWRVEKGDVFGWTPSSPKCIIYLDKHRTKYIDAMVLDAPKPNDVGKEGGIEVYKKLWGDLSSQIPLAMPQTFRLGSFL